MRNLNYSKIKDLLNRNNEPMISMYLPTHNIASEREEDKVRFKNLLNNCKKELKRQGVKTAEIQDEISRAENLLRDGTFWKKQNKGLALFMAPGIFEDYELPEVFKEYCYIGDHFYIKPLLPFLSSKNKYYILAMNQKKIDFYEAGPYQIKEKKLRNTPKTIDEIVQYNDYEEQISVHTTPRGKSAGSAAVFHGQGSNADEKRIKKTIELFVKMLGKGLEKNIGDDKTPIVLVGDDYLRSCFEESQKKFNVVEKGLNCNPSDLDMNQLHERTWNITKEIFSGEIDKNLEYLNNMHDSGKTSLDEKEIVPDAFQGRVNILFLDSNETIWGSQQHEKPEVEVHAEPHEGDVDLMDIAACQTLKYDGTVLNVDKERLPENKKMAAILRY